MLKIPLLKKQQILELPLKLLSTIECLNYICKFNDMSLSLENKKIELIQWLSTLNDTSLIDKLMKLREKEKNDWWNEISENEKISIEKESLMGGMSCGEVSLVPWQILKNSVSHCVTVSDDYISKTIKFLANCEFSDEKIIGGECSTPGIISLIGLCNDAKIRKKINLNEDSNVLLFGCEGDADEELYQKLLNS